MTTIERPAEPAERCTCGRPAVTVFVTERLWEVGWCGVNDGADQAGPCPGFAPQSPARPWQKDTMGAPKLPPRARPACVARYGL